LGFFLSSLLALSLFPLSPISTSFEFELGQLVIIWKQFRITSRVGIFAEFHPACSP
jgi:hypothetical protein